MSTTPPRSPTDPWRVLDAIAAHAAAQPRYSARPTRAENLAAILEAHAHAVRLRDALKPPSPATGLALLPRPPSVKRPA